MSQALNTKEIVRAAGGPKKLGALLGIDHSTISGWKRIPAHHATRIAEISGVPAHVMRPDVFPAAPPQPAP